MKRKFKFIKKKYEKDFFLFQVHQLNVPVNQNQILCSMKILWKSFIEIDIEKFEKHLINQHYKLKSIYISIFYFSCEIFIHNKQKTKPWINWKFFFKLFSPHQPSIIHSLLALNKQYLPLFNMLKDFRSYRYSCKHQHKTEIMR